ncbi:hypothetical protein CAPTEDRAFT_223430 [Capitella teleta]|uniref:Cyclic nucleotide-binding domain-containing protein n=1 Tax=Capitella teleta TaxID=283909 RepID=R7UHE1_CAPTE|nr:hypothetical protein CAPTEDRAFT_223430 [Capitella teleta]|eukprot:ELU02692.1 hypothetical protein CAPTEDRAFT_223430 [Capitella teleta]
MSLVKFDKKVKEKSSWSDRSKRATQHLVPSNLQVPIIDYDKLKELCAMHDALGENGQSEEVHKNFMQNYKDIFVNMKPSIGFPVHSVKRSLQRQQSQLSQTSKSVEAGTRVSGASEVASANEVSHDIRDHMTRRRRLSENPCAIKTQHIKTLRRLLRKQPFERTATENDEILKAAKRFELLSCQADISVLKELCVVAQIEVWKEPDITMFGNTGFHLILKGSVVPQSLPFIKIKGLDDEFRSPTPELKENEVDELGVGDCFGSLEKVSGRDPNSRILTVLTKGKHCEFMKITTSDYTKVIEQIRQREETEKVNLLQSCETYKLWSRQPLIRVASLIEWLSFPANTVLVSEGFMAPFLAIIKTGECHVLRHVTVLHTLPNGRKERQTREVVMGKLTECTSFGEISILKDEPITCSIVTATQVTLATIEPSKLTDLDEITLQLLEQSSERTFGNLTEDNIHEEYVQQELKREWNEFKHNVVMDTINSRGIRPGYGKWAK